MRTNSNPMKTNTILIFLSILFLIKSQILAQNTSFYQESMDKGNSYFNEKEFYDALQWYIAAQNAPDASNDDKTKAQQKIQNTINEITNLRIAAEASEAEAKKQEGIAKDSAESAKEQRKIAQNKTKELEKELEISQLTYLARDYLDKDPTFALQIAYKTYLKDSLNQNVIQLLKELLTLNHYQFRLGFMNDTIIDSFKTIPIIKDSCFISIGNDPKENTRVYFWNNLGQIINNFTFDIETTKVEVLNNRTICIFRGQKLIEVDLYSRDVRTINFETGINGIRPIPNTEEYIVFGEGGIHLVKIPAIVLKSNKTNDIRELQLGGSRFNYFVTWSNFIGLKYWHLENLEVLKEWSFEDLGEDDLENFDNLLFTEDDKILIWTNGGYYSNQRLIYIIRNFKNNKFKIRDLDINDLVVDVIETAFGFLIYGNQPYPDRTAYPFVKYLNYDDKLFNYSLEKYIVELSLLNDNQEFLIWGEGNSIMLFEDDKKEFIKYYEARTSVEKLIISSDNKIWYLDGDDVINQINLAAFKTPFPKAAKYYTNYSLRPEVHQEKVEISFQIYPKDNASFLPFNNNKAFISWGDHNVNLWDIDKNSGIENIILGDTINTTILAQFIKNEIHQFSEAEYYLAGVPNITLEDLKQSTTQYWDFIKLGEYFSDKVQNSTIDRAINKENAIYFFEKAIEVANNDIDKKFAEDEIAELENF